MRPVRDYRRLMPLLVLLFLASGEAAVAKMEVGGQPGEFLRYGAGVRPLSLGGAFVGLADDINCIYYNPAGLTSLPGVVIGGGLRTLIDNDNYIGQIALGDPKVLRIGQFQLGLGMSIVWHAMGNFEYRGSSDQVTDSNGSFRERAFCPAMAIEFCNWWGTVSAGAGLKAVSMDYSEPGDDGHGFTSWDMGLIVKRTFIHGGSNNPRVDAMRIGIAYEDKFQEEGCATSDDAFRIGMSYDKSFGMTHLVFVTDYNLNGKLRPSLGLEARMTLDEVSLILRGGQETLSGTTTIGVGLAWAGGSVPVVKHISVDAALFGHEDYTENTSSEAYIEPTFGLSASAGEYYYKAFEKSADDANYTAARANLGHVVTAGDGEYLERAAIWLALVYDVEHAARYLRLIDELPTCH